MEIKRKVARPDWLKDASPRVVLTLQMWEEGKLPEIIERFMVVVPIKHALRAIYGRSNVGVALILLVEALQERCRQYWYSFLFWSHIMKLEDDLD